MVTTHSSSDNQNPNSSLPPNPPTPLPQPSDPIAQQLSTIAGRLEAVDHLAVEVAALKAQASNTSPPENHPTSINKNKGKELPSGSREFCRPAWSEPDDEEPDNSWWRRNTPQRPYMKIKFPKFEGGDPRGWILKAETYFCYYQTPKDLKVDVATMYLERDALDHFSWLNNKRTWIYWDDLVKALHENYGPAEFQNLDEHLCSIK